MTRGLRELIRIDGVPVLQNRTYANRAEALGCTLGNLNLVQDLTTGLVSNNAYDAGLLTYDPAYQNEQALSPSFIRHLNSAADLLEPYLNRKILEVGCGQGSFLNILRRRGHTVTGIDPAYTGTDADILPVSFGPGLHSGAELIVLRQVFEYFEHPFDLLRQLAVESSGEGLIYIETPNFDFLTGRHAWLNIFYEYVYYYRVDDLRRMFGEVLDSGYLFGRQYMYVIARLGSFHPPLVTDRENLWDFPGTQQFVSELSALACRAGKEKAIVWGAGGRGTMLAHYMARFGRPLDYAVDINPEKQSRYLPGSGVLVLSPAEALDRLVPGTTVFITNPHYFDEIVAMSENRFDYLGIGNSELSS